MSTQTVERVGLRQALDVAWANRSARALMLVHAVDCVGNGIYFATFALYLNRHLHLGPAVVGALLAAGSFVGLFASLLVGRWADRRSPRQILTVLLSALGLSFVALPLRSSVLWVGAFCVVSSVLHICCPAPFVSLIGQSFQPRYRQAGRSLIRSVGNISMAAGSAVAAVGLSVNMQAFLPISPVLDGLTFLAAAALLRLVTVGAAAPPPSQATRSDPRHALRQRGMAGFVAATAVMGLHSTLLATGVPLWISYSHAMPGWSIPVLIGLNTLLVFAFQVSASQRAGASFGAALRWSRLAALSIAGGALLIFFGGRGTLAWLLIVVAFVLFTLAELWQNGSFFHFSFAIATDSQRAEYASALHVSQVLESTLGPLLVGVAMAGLDAGAWPIICGLMAVSALAYPAVGARVRYLFPEEPS
ncbi:MAG TPA: MFS transporter [Rugosimonospora sp.]|nr:MFS transporter [Rugosimonospora sp.]